jgi:hypothetical protein
MNLNILEKVTREINKGGNAERESSELLSRGFITPIEHKSLSSLSWQIAANVRANSGPAANVSIRRLPMGCWI